MTMSPLTAAQRRVTRAATELSNAVDALRELTRDSISSRAVCSNPRVRCIQELVAARFELQSSMMVSPLRPRQVAWPRQIAMYLCRVLLPRVSLEQVGKCFQRDHGTVIHAYRAVTRAMSCDAAARAEVNALRDAAEAALANRQANIHGERAAA